MSREADNDCCSSGILYPSLIDLTTLPNTFYGVKNEQCYSSCMLDANKKQSYSSERFKNSFSRGNDSSAGNCSMTADSPSTTSPSPLGGTSLQSNCTTMFLPLTPVSTQLSVECGEAKEDSDREIKQEMLTSSSKEVEMCQVCGDTAAGFHCGAFVCEACKKFFIRTMKQQNIRYMCMKQERCVVNKETRTQCQYCRYQKCLHLGMYKPGDGPMVDSRMLNIPCRVCGGHSSGYHFGAITCEGCKGFFRRMVRERELPNSTCSKGGNCEITLPTRNLCKVCRYWKCIRVGMSATGSRIGRQPNSVKHATMLELKGLKCEPVVLSEPIVGGHLHVATPFYSNSKHASAQACDLLIPKQEPQDHLFDHLSFCRDRDHSDMDCGCQVAMGEDSGEPEMRHWTCGNTSFLPPSPPLQPVSPQPAPPSPPRPPQASSLHQNIQSYSPRRPDSPHRPCLQNIPDVIVSEEYSRTGNGFETNADKCSVLKMSTDKDAILKNNVDAKVCPGTVPVLTKDKTNCIHSEHHTLQIFSKYVHSPAMRCDTSRTSAKTVDLIDSVCKGQSPCSSNGVHSDADRTLDTHNSNRVNNGAVSSVSMMDNCSLDKLSSGEVMDSLHACGKELKLLNKKFPDTVLSEADDAAQIWSKLMNQFFHCSHAIILFAKRVPYFRKLPMETQVFLIRSNIYSITVVNMSRVYNRETGLFSFFNFTVMELEMILQHIPEMNLLCDHLKLIGDTLTCLECDDLELTFLSMLNLLSADGDLLNDQKSARKLLEKITIALEDYEMNVKGDNGIRFGQVMLRIAELRQINIQHFEIMSTFIRENSSLGIPELYLEMFGEKEKTEQKL